MTSESTYEQDQSLWGTVMGSGTDRRYISKPGDTFEALAGFFYGDATHSELLKTENPGWAGYQAGASLPAGSRLRVPEPQAAPAEQVGEPSDAGTAATVEETLATEAPAAETSAPEPRRYTVVAGDSLSAIAQREYGDAGQWPRIFEANRDQIDNPDLILPGQELRIPE